MKNGENYKEKCQEMRRYLYEELGVDKSVFAVDQYGYHPTSDLGDDDWCVSLILNAIDKIENGAIEAAISVIASAEKEVNDEVGAVYALWRGDLGRMAEYSYKAVIKAYKKTIMRTNDKNVLIDVYKKILAVEKENQIKVVLDDDCNKKISGLEWNDIYPETKREESTYTIKTDEELFGKTYS